MGKTHAELQREEIEAHKRGEFRYEPDPPYITIDDPEEFQRGVNEILKLNGLPPRKLKPVKSPYEGMTRDQIRIAKAEAHERARIRFEQEPPYFVEPGERLKANRSGSSVRKKSTGEQKAIPVSKDFYTQVATEAKREKISMEKYLKKLMGKK